MCTVHVCLCVHVPDRRTCHMCGLVHVRSEIGMKEEGEDADYVFIHVLMTIITCGYNLLFVKFFLYFHRKPKIDQHLLRG